MRVNRYKLRLKIGKFTWQCILLTDSERLAKGRAKLERSRSRYTRIIETPRGYGVYIRMKNAS